jgi:hypothetical protein
MLKIKVKRRSDQRAVSQDTRHVFGYFRVLIPWRAVVNAFIKPQFTLYHNGSGLPSFHLSSGLFFLFQKK